ncbi:sodium:proton antiporter NhaD [Thermodesulfobacteriota bacterium]
MKATSFIILLLFSPICAWAGEQSVAAGNADFTSTWYGYLGLIIFLGAYSLVPFEDKFNLRKSKPVLLAAGVIWVLLSIAYIQIGDTYTAHKAIKEGLLEYAELFLFLLVAMTYVNALEERNVFQSLRGYLVSKGYSLRSIFWLSGMLAFFISPLADNLTTALLMGAVVMAVGGDNKKFVAISCINIIVAANAGGAFSPFGDITTLMVWQKGKVQFTEFFSILIPSIVNWLVPAIIMSLAVEKKVPKIESEKVAMKYGSLPIIFLFLLTIATAVCFHNFLHLPPATGMMLGLGYLGLFSFHVKMREGELEKYDYVLGARGYESLHPFRSFKNRKKPISGIIDKIQLPAFALDANHLITHWNRECEMLTGFKASKMIGTKKQWTPFYSDERPVLADLVLESFSKTEMEKHYKRKHLEGLQIEDTVRAFDFFPDLGEHGKWLTFTAAPIKDEGGEITGAVEVLEDFTERKAAAKHFDIMKNISRAEWDTLMFFYGVILCVGGIAQFGYLNLISSFIYQDLGATTANILVGVLSAILDNIPVMFAVLKMDPSMTHGQWLLVTLTAGTGGSMLAIGSAAGVALLGTARGVYTFRTHLKWTPVIALGYGLSILAHIFINSALM